MRRLFKRYRRVEEILIQAQGRKGNYEILGGVLVRPYQRWDNYNKKKQLYLTLTLADIKFWTGQILPVLTTGCFTNQPFQGLVYKWDTGWLYKMKGSVHLKSKQQISLGLWFIAQVKKLTKRHD